MEEVAEPVREAGGTNGAVVAALLGAMIGLLVFAFVNLGTEVSSEFKAQVLALGKSWIPNAEGIGPYSGKETFMFLSWLGSWAPIHFLLRKRDLNLQLWFIVFLVGVVVATFLLWPPVFKLIAG
ncbi:MAG: hypothetical protein ACE5LS_00840 [Thermoplasmata archaeon]